MGLIDFIVRLVVPDPPDRKSPAPSTSQRASPRFPASTTPRLGEEILGEPRRSPSKRVADRKGTRNTEEEQEAARANLVEHMRRSAANRNARDFNRAQAAGATHYIWRATGDGDTCQACLRREGRKFRINGRSPSLRPGEFACGDHGYCRCFPEFIFPGLD